MLIFLSVSANSLDLHFSTNSLRELYDSCAVRVTRVDSSTVCCPNSPAIVSDSRLGFFTATTDLFYSIIFYSILHVRINV